MEATMNRHQEAMKAQMVSLISKMDAHHARTEANHERMMAKLGAHHERIMATIGKTEATDLEANSEEIQSKAVHREVRKEKATVKSSGTLK
jgi:CII-binding regulator of phage lambda lysogenization HflD